MALNSTRGGVLGRRPSTRGKTYSRVSRGVEIVQSWPRKRGNNLPEKTKEQMQFFREVQWAFKLMHPALQNQYRAAVAGTPLLPRDLYLMASANRMLELHLPDNIRIFSMAQVTDMSKMLDILGQITGDMLIRGLETWERLPAGEEGQVLTAQAEGELPAWAPAAGGGSAAWTQLPTVTISAPVASVVFDVSAYNDVMLLGRLLTTAVTSTRGMQVSTDGGVTWLNVNNDYFNVATTGVESGTFICGHHGTPSTAARDCGGIIMALRAPNGPHMVQSFSNTPALIKPLAAPITHVRILAQSNSGLAPNNLTGGTVYAWAR